MFTWSFNWIFELHSSKENQTFWTRCHIPWRVTKQLLISPSSSFYSGGGASVLRMRCTVLRWLTLFTGRGVDVVPVYRHIRVASWFVLHRCRHTNMWTEHTPTLEDSVRMSLESLTRHCRGTVTSMTFDFSCFWPVSETNFPYQAFRMISPGQ